MAVRLDPPHSNLLGNELVTSEMRALCELCEKVNLNPLVAMSKDELLPLIELCSEHALTLSGNHSSLSTTCNTRHQKVQGCCETKKGEKKLWLIIIR